MHRSAESRKPIPPRYSNFDGELWMVVKWLVVQDRSGFTVYNGLIYADMLNMFTGVSMYESIGGVPRLTVINSIFNWDPCFLSVYVYGLLTLSRIFVFLFLFPFFFLNREKNPNVRMFDRRGLSLRRRKIILRPFSGHDANIELTVSQVIYHCEMKLCNFSSVRRLFSRKY